MTTAVWFSATAADRDDRTAAKITQVLGSGSVCWSAAVRGRLGIQTRDTLAPNVSLRKELYPQKNCRIVPCWSRTPASTGAGFEGLSLVRTQNNGSRHAYPLRSSRCGASQRDNSALVPRSAPARSCRAAFRTAAVLLYNKRYRQFYDRTCFTIERCNVVDK